MDYTKLEQEIGYIFKDKNLLQTALTHTSYSYERKTVSNEKLEFLGDSILEFLSSIYIYKNYPKLKEGEMTKVRAQVVCETSLYKVAKSHDFSDFLRLGKSEKVAHKEVKPAIMADSVEAVIAAMYLDGGIEPVNKFIVENLKENYGLKENASMFFIADEFKTAQKIAGQVRIELGNRLDLLEKNVYRFCFIVDFPMYEYNEDEGKVDFNHNPFSMPQGGMEALENKDPLDILAYQYDLVCNGYEMASGAVRNHNPEIMVKAFEIAGYSEEDVKTKFGALYNAFQYGTPPHAGAAPGIDRMVMLIEDSSNIREVIAFPKNKRARDLLMRAPSKVSDGQLKDVHIKLDLEEK